MLVSLLCFKTSKMNAGSFSLHGKLNMILLQTSQFVHAHGLTFWRFRSTHKLGKKSHLARRLNWQTFRAHKRRTLHVTAKRLPVVFLPVLLGFKDWSSFKEWSYCGAIPMFTNKQSVGEKALFLHQRLHWQWKCLACAALKAPKNMSAGMKLWQLGNNVPLSHRTAQGYRCQGKHVRLWNIQKNFMCTQIEKSIHLSTERTHTHTRSFNKAWNYTANPTFEAQWMCERDRHQHTFSSVSPSNCSVCTCLHAGMKNHSWRSPVIMHWYVRFINCTLSHIAKNEKWGTHPQMLQNYSLFGISQVTQTHKLSDASKRQ